MHFSLLHRTAQTPTIPVSRGIGLLAAATLLVACTGSHPRPLPAASPARITYHEAFPSAYVSPRRITVWLPPGYDTGRDRYAVLYMHDGQNLLDPRTSMSHHAWEVDRHLSDLLGQGRIRGTILVGIDNSGTRWQDYAPQQPFSLLSPSLQVLAMGKEPGAPHSDGYLRFLVEELKPFVDAHYRTRPEREQTFVMGSSMGGLISLYALARYPEVFGGAACLSTHWPYTTNAQLLRANDDPDGTQIGNATIRWLGAHVPEPATHRLYFDHGTEFLDALYAPYQQQVDAILLGQGYADGVNFRSVVFQGATHNEQSWNERLDVPLTFLLAP